MNISGVSNPIREYELRGRRTANATSAAQNFEEQIVRESASQSAAASVPATADVPVAATISGADYLKLQQESAAANSPEAKSAAEHKALIAAADNTAFERAAAKPEAAAPAKEAVTILPTDTTEVKLEKLRQIAAASDYTGMSYDEIFTSIYTRYNNAFDGMLEAITGPCLAMSSDWSKIDIQFEEEIRDYVDKPLREMFKAKGVRADDLAENDEYMQIRKDITNARAVLCGYSADMSADETEAAIFAKYQGKTSFSDFLSMQGELWNLGVYYNRMGADGASDFVSQMRSEISINYLGNRIEQEGILTSPQRGMKFTSPIALLNSEQWNTLLQSSFDTRSFFVAMKENLKNVTFENYDYDVRGMLNSQIDNFMGLMNKHWSDGASSAVESDNSLSADEYRMEERRQEASQTIAEE